METRKRLFYAIVFIVLLAGISTACNSQAAQNSSFLPSLNPSPIGQNVNLQDAPPTADFQLSTTKTGAATQSLLPTISNTPTNFSISSTAGSPTENPRHVEISEDLSSLIQDDLLRVYFIDVDQGDSLLIQTPTGENILIDGGNEDGRAVGFLENHQIQKLDMVIATHNHPDHIGGLIEVLQTIPVRTVITSHDMDTTDIYNRFLEAILSSKAEHKEVMTGDTFDFGELKFTVLNPLILDRYNMNNNSIVLRMVYKSVSFLLMADAETAVENRILTYSSIIKSDVLKIGHHGSSTSSSLPFLSMVSPSIAIYFAGDNNSFYFPDLMVIQRLASLGIKVYGTDVNGTIIVATDGEKINVQTSK